MAADSTQDAISQAIAAATMCVALAATVFFELFDHLAVSGHHPKDWICHAAFFASLTISALSLFPRVPAFAKVLGLCAFGAALEWVEIVHTAAGDLDNLAAETVAVLTAWLIFAGPARIAGQPGRDVVLPMSAFLWFVGFIVAIH